MADTVSAGTRAVGAVAVMLDCYQEQDMSTTRTSAT